MGMGAVSAAKTFAPPRGDYGELRVRFHPAKETVVHVQADCDPALVPRRAHPQASRPSAPAGVLPGTKPASELTSGRAVSTTAKILSRSDREWAVEIGLEPVLRKLEADLHSQGTTWGLTRLRRALRNAGR